MNESRKTAARQELGCGKASTGPLHNSGIPNGYTQKARRGTTEGKTRHTEGKTWHTEGKTRHAEGKTRHAEGKTRNGTAGRFTV